MITDLLNINELYFFLFQVVKMLIIVVSLFAVCWLPLQAYNILVPLYKDQITS